MNKISKSDKFKALIIDLRIRFSLADPLILQGIDNYLSTISNQKLVFSKINRGGIVFGCISVVHIFCEIFDPLLTKLISQSPLVRDELKVHDVSLPLANKLIASEDLNNCVLKFNYSAAHFDYIAEHSHERNIEIIRSGESLKVIAELLHAILSTIQTDEITWCKSCFRRAIVNFEYCKIHYSTDEASQDTSNRKANRVFKLIDNEVIKMWGKHRVRRKIGGESVFLMPDKLPTKGIYPTETWLTTSQELIAFVEATIKNSWSEMTSEWNRVLYSFPEISKRFLKPAESFANWDDFVAGLFHALQEPIETTRHPLWVIYIMKDAEAWFVAERNYSDRRRNDTRTKVEELFQSGDSVSDIAAQLNLTKKHVAQLMHDMNYSSGVSI